MVCGCVNHTKCHKTAYDDWDHFKISSGQSIKLGGLTYYGKLFLKIDSVRKNKQF